MLTKLVKITTPGTFVDVRCPFKFWQVCVTQAQGLIGVKDAENNVCSNLPVGFKITYTEGQPLGVVSFTSSVAETITVAFGKKGEDIYIDPAGNPTIPPSPYVAQAVAPVALAGAGNSIFIVPLLDYKALVLSFTSYLLNDSFQIGWIDPADGGTFGAFGGNPGFLPFNYPDGTQAGTNDVTLVVPNPGVTSRFTIVIPVLGASQIFVKSIVNAGGMVAKGHFTNSWT
jgi:hypothetical protein